jgi:hypothetical protein
MGLDAFVFCDCFEKGRTKGERPCPKKLVFVQPNGDIDCRSKDGDLLERFTEWRENFCKHDCGILVGAHIGSAAHIERLFEAISAEAKLFPILLKKVLYCGTHCSDHLSLKSVQKLKLELKVLRKFRWGDKELDEAIRMLYWDLDFLVCASLKIGKPISF